MKKSSMITLFMLMFTSTTMGSSVGWKSKRIEVRVTAYCPCKICCGNHANGKTATGRDAYKNGVAVDPTIIPLGSRLDIPGYGNWQLADDVGGAIKNNHIDVRFKTHKEALKWGTKTIKIRVWIKNN